ncbi:MAG: hypothetical protein ACKVPX_17155 [Myxococcaceae bacterium]
MIRHALLLLFCALPLAAIAQTEGSVGEMVATTHAPKDQDACLDHSVRELGMSAKKVEGARHWVIGPQFLHPSLVPGGAVDVMLEPAPNDQTRVTARARWSASSAVLTHEGELASRLKAIPHKMAQACGVTRPQVSCSVAVQNTKRPCRLE